MNTLPDEIIEIIFINLTDLASYRKLCQIDQRFHNIGNDERVKIIIFKKHIKHFYYIKWNEVEEFEGFSNKWKHGEYLKYEIKDTYNTFTICKVKIKDKDKDKLLHPDNIRQTLVQCFYQYNLLEGLYLQWNTNGKMVKESNYKHGEKCGLSKKYYGDGHRKSEGFYINNKKHGMFKRWHFNGTLIHAGIYADGQKNGKIEDWYWYNKQPQEECCYKDGYPDGILKIWSSTGQLKYQRYFKNKQLVYNEIIVDGKIVSRQKNGHKYPLIMNRKGIYRLCAGICLTGKPCNRRINYLKYRTKVYCASHNMYSDSRLIPKDY